MKKFIKRLFPFIFSSSTVERIEYKEPKPEECSHQWDYDLDTNIRALDLMGDIKINITYCSLCGKIDNWGKRRKIYEEPLKIFDNPWKKE